jgi:hypothetical protein
MSAPCCFGRYLMLFPVEAFARLLKSSAGLAVVKTVGCTRCGLEALRAFRQDKILLARFELALEGEITLRERTLLGDVFEDLEPVLYLHVREFGYVVVHGYNLPLAVAGLNRLEIIMRQFSDGGRAVTAWQHSIPFWCRLVRRAGSARPGTSVT